MSTSHRTSTATAAALASASLALLGALLAPAAAATEAPPAPSVSAPAASSAPAAPASAAPADGGSAPAAGAQAPAATSLVVRAGDTLTALARRAGTPGGWPALYAANRDALGASPDRLVPGTVLVLPAGASAEAPPVGPAAPGPVPATTYRVERGDSLRHIAERTGVQGGWPALYAANRAAVGPDPDVLVVGTQLALPAAAAPTGGEAAPAAPAPAPSSPQDGPGAGLPGSAPSSSAPAPSARPPQASSAADDAPQAAGLPSWVVWPMVVVAVLGLVALLGDPLLALLRRHRGQQPAPAPAGQHSVVPAGAGEADAGAAVGAAVAQVVPLRAVPRRRPALHVRSYASLLVTYAAADDLVLVLAPVGQDAEEALRVARVVLPDEVFGAVEAELPSALLAEERRRSSRLGA